MDSPCRQAIPKGGLQPDHLFRCTLYTRLLLNFVIACHAEGIRCYVLPIQVRLCTFGTRNVSEGCCLHSRAAQHTKHACVGQALHAMMRCVSSEHPHISWQARDMSANHPMLQKGSLSTLAAESKAEIADGASVISAPLLVPSAGVHREGLLHGAVSSPTWAPFSTRDSACTGL